MKKVFLGGTCNGSMWRNNVIQRLAIDYFNPVVADWNEEDYQRELKERQECDYCLYVITPVMDGFYSIAEVVDDSNKRPEKTIFCFIQDDKRDSTGAYVTFDKHQIKTLEAIGKMVENNGGKWFNTLHQVVKFLNSTVQPKEKPLIKMKKDTEVLHTYIQDEVLGIVSLDGLDLTNMYAESIRRINFQKSNLISDFCKRMVECGLFKRRVGIICPSCGRMISAYDDEKMFPKSVKCEICEQMEEDKKWLFGIEECRTIDVYRLDYIELIDGSHRLQAMLSQGLSVNIELSKNGARIVNGKRYVMCKDNEAAENELKIGDEYEIVREADYSFVIKISNDEISYSKIRFSQPYYKS